MKTIKSVLLIGVLLFAVLNLLYAQNVVVGGFNHIAAPVQPAPEQPSPPDSIVQITAEAQGLQLVAPADQPKYGTYWLVLGNGIVPFPAPPKDTTQPVYAITDTQFLVDCTGGQVATPPLRLGMQRQNMTASITSALEYQAGMITSLITQVQTREAQRQMRSMAMAMGIPSFGGGDSGSGDGSGGVIANGSTFVQDYGANLWIAQTAVAAGYLTAIATNTQTDIQYEILSRTNLLQTDWQSEGFIFGSALTNWTPLSVAQNGRTDLFIRLKSWASSDGSGLPDWWELAYFGYTGVDPYGNPAGDGYSNLYKFQNGMNPNVFYTPAAPQGVTVNLHQTANTATIAWVPSAGAVTGYTVEKTDSNPSPATVQDFTVSASGTSYTNDISGNSPDPWNGNTYDVSYRIKANYTNGGSSAWSASIPLQQPTVSASITPGANGTTVLAVSGVPTNAATVRLFFLDYDTEGSSFNHTEDIPVSSFVNGLYQLPAANQPVHLNEYGYPDEYWVFAESVDASGNASGGNFCFSTGSPVDSYNWAQPFYDGRLQLKQNLIFSLRAAQVDTPFQFTYDNDSYGDYQTAPTNYAFSGYYHVAPPIYFEMDALLPFEENTVFRNFVFNTSNLDPNTGVINTGVVLGVGWYGENALALATNATFQFQAPSGSWTNLPGLLSASTTSWLYSIPFASTWQESGYESFGECGITDTYNNNNDTQTFSLGTVYNLFGLQFLSAKLVGASDSPGYTLNTLNANGSLTFSQNKGYSPYAGTAQPQFQTVEYDFWCPGGSWNPVTQTWTYFLPGTPGFSPTNQSQLLVTAVGYGYFQVAGYAKLAVANSIYSGVYGYLGQYFEQAYTMTNGVVTTNTTGVLSPYGNFFATEPGQVALVTMSDLDTGARGTGMVYCVSLNVDKNHDGNMDLSFNGPDVTSQSSPFVFWANNNYDRWLYDVDDTTNYEDGLDSINVGKLPSNQRVPDCNYRDINGNRIIPCTRDLEDFTRLWVSGINPNLLAALPAGYTITLNWGDVGSPNPANPTIDLFQAADSDGGTGYLTNATIAATQINTQQSPYIGRIAPGGSIQLNASQFANNWAGNHFIWCGVSNGTGGLNLTITDNNGNTLAQSTAYIQIQDIKNMYERWTVGDQPSVAPLTTAINAANDLPSPRAFNYTAPTDANTPYILFVHGWNMRTDDKDIFAETAFKRLYWQGYQGRFGSFRWPTGSGFTGWKSVATDSDNFDNSEYQAWQSAQGLLNKLNELNTQYPNRVYLLAHSMGNVVAGEALRLAGSSQVVKTYVASQAAVSAHTYDLTVANYSFNYSIFNFGPDTPNIYGNWFAGNSGGGAGQVISFYNVNDYALARTHWQLDQLFKPDQGVLKNGDSWSYHYNGNASDPSPWNHFSKYNESLFYSVNFDIANVLTNRYEVMAYAAQSYTTALGATPGAHHLADSIDLSTIWPPDTDPRFQNNPYGEHFYHSAEFRGDNAQQQSYWTEMLGADAFNLK